LPTFTELWFGETANLKVICHKSSELSPFLLPLAPKNKTYPFSNPLKELEFTFPVSSMICFLKEVVTLDFLKKWVSEKL
jgi:hypothetical protein